MKVVQIARAMVQMIQTTMIPMTIQVKWIRNKFKIFTTLKTTFFILYNKIFIVLYSDRRLVCIVKFFKKNGSRWTE